MTDKLEPTQADRIRFAEGWDEPMHKSAILDGEWDDNEHLQRFTAHRIEAERAALERAATWEGAANQLDVAVRDYFDFDEGDDGSLDEIFPTARAEYMDAINKALAAISALAQEVK